MSNKKEKSNNKELIDTQAEINEVKNIENNSFSQEILNENILNSSEKLIDNKKTLLNTPVNVTVELGRSKIKIKDFLSFSKGSMIILDKLIKEPLDIFINGHLIASGEIVVSKEKYGLRIVSIKNSLKNINDSV